MKSIVKRPIFDRPVMITLGALIVFFVGMILTASAYAAPEERPIPTAGERLITVHDNGKDRGILTKATTLRQAFASAKIHIDPNDLVEPGLDETLVAGNYEVNIYRARPVTIVDGSVRVKVMSPYQTPQQIAEHAGVTMHDEDEATMGLAGDMVSGGVGVKLAIDRATEFTFIIYGKKTTAYTQESTVADMLKKKDITLGSNDVVSANLDTPIKAGMTIELWRNGVQTVTEEQDVAFEVEKIQDADREVGFKEVKTLGEKGKKTVTYEIEMKNGKELKRKEIRTIVVQEPKKQVEVIGTKLSLPAGSHEDWMRQAGIATGDFGYANAIFQQESGWRPAARNPAGYVGLGQTNEENLSAACPQWQSDPICQIQFFDGYAKGRYGSWHAAYIFKFGDGASAGHGWW